MKLTPITAGQSFSFVLHRTMAGIKKMKLRILRFSENLSIFNIWRNWRENRDVLKTQLFEKFINRLKSACGKNENRIQLHF